MTRPNLLSPEYVRDPVPFYPILRDEHPLFFDEGTRSWVISRYDDVRHALKDASFSSRHYEWQLEPVYGRTIIQMDGKEHAAHRGVIGHVFRERTVRTALEPMMRAVAHALIDAFRQDGEVDLVEQFTSRFPISVLASMLGLPTSDYEHFRRWYHALMRFFSNLARDPGIDAEGLAVRAEMRAYLAPYLSERRARAGDDLLSLLCHAEVDGLRLSDEAIMAFCTLLIGAAGESVDRTLTNMFKQLLARPELLERLRRDRDLIDRAFLETLRHSPPGNMLMRVATEEVTMSAGVIPAGATVSCVLGAANRDQRRFERPDEFDILRPELDPRHGFTAAASHLTFGLGRHFCIGAALARMEVAIATNALLDAMHDIQLADGVAPPDVGYIMRSAPSLRLRFTPAS